MKKAKKFLISLLAFASISAFALGVTACKDDGTDSGDLPPEQQNAIEQVYDSYVEYATAQGQTPLDYETWLATIKGATGAKGDKGDKGVGIESVQVDEDGMMIITLTDGTVLPAIELPTGEPIEKGATRNLHYQRIAGKDEYRVIGLGLAAENDIVISSTYNGLPVTEIGDEAFANSYSISIEIPDSVTAIGDYAFMGCDGLESIYYKGSISDWCTIEFKLIKDFSSNPLYNGADLYINNEKVVDLVIPDDVETIKNCTFYGASFESVTIPDSVTTIGYSAFEYCDSLTSVYYTGDIEDWCAIDFGSSSANPLYNGADFYIDNEKVVDLVIPDGVETINDYAFFGANFESVTIPDSVTTIGRSAFFNCDSLTSVTIGNSVTTIGSEAFSSCDSLTNITIGNSVTTIGSEAFSSCDSLTNITIPDSVTTIGKSAFSSCRSLTSVVFEDTSTWYRTDDYEDWQNKVNGKQVDVSDAEVVAVWLTYGYYYYWYKL